MRAFDDPFTHQVPPTPDRVGPRVRTLYVVTHTEASHHVEGLVGGWYDSQLTSAGERDAVLVAQDLRRRIPPNNDVEVVSSDLRRAQQTADAVGRVLGVQPLLDSRLREKSYGVAGGRPQEWLDARFVPPPAVGDRLRHIEGVEGAEMWETFARRVYAGVASLLGREGANQVVVTHGGAGQLVVAAWLGLPVEATSYARFRMPSGSISVLREDGFFHNREVSELGCIAHLGVHA